MSAQQQRTNAKLLGLLGGLLLAAAGAMYVTGGLEASVPSEKVADADVAANITKDSNIKRAAQPAETAPVPEETAEAERAPEPGSFADTYAEYMAASDPAILVPERFKGLGLPSGWRAVTDYNFGIGVDVETGDLGAAVRPVKGLDLEMRYKEFGASDAAREQVTQWLNSTALWYAHPDTRPTDGLARAHYFAPTGGAFDVILDGNTPAGSPVMLDGYRLYFDAADTEVFEARLADPTQQAWDFAIDSAAGGLTVEGAGTVAELRTFLAAIPTR